MKGFLVIGYNNNCSNIVSLNKLEKFLIEEKKSYNLFNIDSRTFENIIGIQIHGEKKPHFEINPSRNFFCGNIYGPANKVNHKKLNIIEANEYIDKNDKSENFHPLDGSCSYVRIENEAIIFQSDIEGYKKVFYYNSNDLFCVSNNLSYILKIIEKQWKIRRNAVFSYLLQRESKWPLTFIEGIHVLPPVTRGIRLLNNISLNSITYSSLYDKRKTQKNNVIDTLLGTYTALIERDFSSNQAVTLSGGFDSNCLTKLSAMTFNDKFTAVSLGYDSIKTKDAHVYNETVYAEKIAKHLKIPFKKYIVGKELFFSHLDNFIKSIDQPGHDPSSNFILNSLLKKDGFDSVMSGMGGDACFAPKTMIKNVKNLYQITNLTNSYPILNLLSTQLKYKWLFKYFDTKLFFKKPNSFNQIIEALKLNKNKLDAYLSGDIKLVLFEEESLRNNYYNQIYHSSKADLDIFYSYSIFSNPDEYHADIMAERNGLDIIMPFVNINPILELFNASNYVDTCNRDFETKIFKEINRDLLLKSKSGFSMPYTEWAHDFTQDTMSYFVDLDFFSKDDFNISKFMDDYKNNELFRNSLPASQLIWKLTIVKRYVEYHSLNF